MIILSSLPNDCATSSSITSVQKPMPLFNLGGVGAVHGGEGVVSVVGELAEHNMMWSRCNVVEKKGAVRGHHASIHHGVG